MILDCKFRVATVATTLLLVSGAAARADTITIGENGVTTIQQAVTAALDNADAEDTILVPKGEYTETVSVNYTTGSGATQTGLTIKRKGKKGQVRVTGASGAAFSIASSTNVVMSNVDVQSSSPGDGTPAIVVNTCQNLLFTKVNGVAGDDLGVVVLNANSMGIRFDRCDFSGMAGIGFSIDGFGHELRDCKADACGLNAVVLTDQALNCWIIDCSAVAAGGSSVTHPGTITLRGNGHRVMNTATGGSGSNGIYAVGNGHILDGCSSDGSVGAGYRIDDAEVLLIDCSASDNDNGYEGGGLGASVIGGKFNSNATSGLRISEGGINLRGLSANKNGGDGVLVTAAAAGANIRDCKFKLNGLEGVQVNGSLAWLEGNSAKEGDGLIDGGANNSGRDNVVKDGGTNDF